jgi:hypothetical protein
MTPRLLIRVGLAGALGFLALDLAACGKQGSLDRPGPLFGSARSQERRERAAAGRADQQTNPTPGTTSQTNGDYSQSADGAKDPALLPFRSNPPPGAPNQFGTTPSAGTLPNPINDPNRIPR